MQKELESGDLYVILVSLKCLKIGILSQQNTIFFVWFFFLNTYVCKAPYIKQALILVQVLLIVILILIQVLVTHMQTGVRRR